MPLRPFRTPRKGGQISAAELKRLVETVFVHEQVNSHVGVGVLQTGGGLVISDRKLRPLWATITSGTQPYAWTEEQQDTAGTWLADSQGLTGTTTNLPAYEINGNTSVPAGVFVQLWPANFGGDWFYLFANPGAELYGYWKNPVRVATVPGTGLPAYTRSSNTLTASANGALPSIDGISLAVNDRLLYKDGPVTGTGGAHADCGIFYISDLGSGSTPWVAKRTADADSSAKMKSGQIVTVQEGTVNGCQSYKLMTADPITLNTTSLSYGTLPTGGTSVPVVLAMTGTTTAVPPASGIMDVSADKHGRSLSFTSTGVVSGQRWDVRNTGSKMIRLTAQTGSPSSTNIYTGIGNAEEFALHPGFTIDLRYSTTKGWQVATTTPAHVGLKFPNRQRVMLDTTTYTLGQFTTGSALYYSGWSDTYICPKVSLATNASKAEAAVCGWMDYRPTSGSGDTLHWMVTSGSIGYTSGEISNVIELCGARLDFTPTYAVGDLLYASSTAGVLIKTQELFAVPVARYLASMTVGANSLAQIEIIGGTGFSDRKKLEPPGERDVIAAHYAF